MKIPLAEKTVLAVDPGETTGLYLKVGNASTITGEFSYEEMREECQKAIADGYWFGCKVKCIEAVVVETFRVYPQKAQALTHDTLLPSRIIGMLDFVAYYHNIPVVFQSASEVKGFWTDERLRENGYWHESKHVRDAMRHALYYLMKEAQKERIVESKAEPRYYETKYVTHDGPGRISAPECDNCGTGTLLSPLVEGRLEVWGCGVCKHIYELLPEGGTRDISYRLG